MSSAPHRLFLGISGPELRHFSEQLENALCAHPQLAFAPEPLASENGIERGASPSDFQEGDLLLTLDLGSHDGRDTEALRQRAAQRGLLVFPFLLAQDLVVEGPEAHTVPGADFHTPILSVQNGVSALVREILQTLDERLRMCAPETDVLVRWPDPEAVPEDPFGAIALKLLESSSTGEPAPLREMAREQCRQAAVAIRARLLKVAEETLHRAAAHDATCPVIAYWIARLKVARNHADSLEAGLQDATRAARLARLQDNQILETAAWRLAARICSIGRDPTIRRHLAAAAQHEPARRDLAIDRLWLLHRAGLEGDSLAVLDALYAEDRGVSRIITEDAAYVPFRSHLQTLHDREEVQLRCLFAEVWENAQALARARALPAQDAPAPPVDEKTDLLDWLEHVTRESVEEQLLWLNAWGVELIEATAALRQLRRDLQAVASAGRSMPVRNDLDAILERLWPRLRRRFAALRDALSETDRLQKELTAEEAESHAALRRSTEQFVALAETFETLLLRHPELLTARASARFAQLQQLRVVESAEALESVAEPHEALLPEDLCDVLEFPNPTRAFPALYRWNSEDGEPAEASRTAVFFAQAREQLSQRAT